ncbi:MAG: hypothetical protein AAFR39_02205 [Pseudomonadota bacterium]
MSRAMKQPVIPESEIRISKTSILMVVALVVLSILLVAYARVTGNGTLKTGGADITQIGLLAFERVGDGFQLVGKRVQFDTDQTAFAQGAIRSLERMNGGPLPEGTTFKVLQVRGGLVFLERVENGDRISLDAFSRAKAQSLASILVANGSGELANAN